MAQHYSFRDPVTNRLKSHGFTESNQVGDIRKPEVENFDVDPLKGYQWNGQTWVLVGPEPKPKERNFQDLRAAIATALAVPIIPTELKAVLRKLETFLG